MSAHLGRLPTHLATLLIIFSTLLWGTADPAQAHPLGNFTINHYAGINIQADRADIDYVLDMAEIPTFQVIQQWDPKHTLDPETFNSYQLETCQDISAALTVSLNDRNLPLRLLGSSITFPEGVGGLATLRLTCQFQSLFSMEIRDGDPSSKLVFVNQVYPHRLGWREITVSSETIPIQSPVATTSLSQRLESYPTDLLSSPLDQREVNISLYPQDPSLEVTEEAEIKHPFALFKSQPSLLGRQEDPITTLLGSKARDPLAIALALLIAFIWGGAHALTPGHGKTLVGAYLIGSRGTAADALVLGLTTTFTHTASIFVVGFIALGASQFLITEQLYSWLSLISGGMVITLGSYLFRQRFIELRSNSDHHYDSQRNDHDHSHTHDHHSHTHNHHHHTHDHHSHTHDHHTHPIPEKLNFSGLLAIGISGGLLPCPSALLVMLGSIGLGQIRFGFALVIAFSLGLAVVLTGIGLLFIYAQKWIPTESFRLPSWRGWSTVGSVLILLIGLGMMIQAVQELRLS